MSLHEISGGRDSNRERNDFPRDSPEASGQSDRAAAPEAASHRSPSSGGPDGSTGADTGESTVSAGERATPDAADEREPGPATAEGRSADAGPTEPVAYVHPLEEYERSKPDGARESIGMQSQMGRSSTDRSSAPSSGLPSEIARLQSSRADEAQDSDGYDPACAQASWFLAIRQRTDVRVLRADSGDE